MHSKGAQSGANWVARISLENQGGQANLLAKFERGSNQEWEVPLWFPYCMGISAVETTATKCLPREIPHKKGLLIPSHVESYKISSALLAGWRGSQRTCWDNCCLPRRTPLVQRLRSWPVTPAIVFFRPTPSWLSPGRSTCSNAYRKRINWLITA